MRQRAIIALATFYCLRVLFWPMSDNRSGRSCTEGYSYDADASAETVKEYNDHCKS